MVSDKEETSVSENSQAGEEKVELTKYELMLILMPDLSSEELDKNLKNIKKHIKDMSGEIYHEDNWDVRDLAYQIKKQDKGYYVIFYFTLRESGGIKEFEHTLKLDHSIIRHLLVKSPKAYEMKKLSELELSEEDLKKKAAPRPKKAKFAPVEKKEVAEKPEKKVKEEKPEKEEKPKAAKEKKTEEKKAAIEVETKEEEKVVEKEKEAEEKKPEEKAEEKEEKKEEKKDEKKKSLDISDLDSKLESILDSDLDLKI